MEFEYLVLFILAFLLALILLWKKFRSLDKRLERMQQQINELRWIESRLFLMGVNARPTAVQAASEFQKGSKDAPAGLGSTTLAPPVDHSK
jgi:hypothetical protein